MTKDKQQPECDFDDVRDRLNARIERLREGLRVTAAYLEQVMPRNGYTPSHECMRAVKTARTLLEDS